MKANRKGVENEKPAENPLSDDPKFIERQDLGDDTKEEFPGYPHYPAREDIMHPANRMEKVNPDPEKLTRSGAYLDPRSLDKPVSASMDTAPESDEELIIVPGTEADVTREDLIILGEQNLENDEEESVDSKVLYGDIATDLDVPGEELDDRNEELGEEDEENNYYSLGGDNKEPLEEN